MPQKNHSVSWLLNVKTNFRSEKTDCPLLAVHLRHSRNESRKSRSESRKSRSGSVSVSHTTLTKGHSVEVLSKMLLLLLLFFVEGGWARHFDALDYDELTRQISELSERHPNLVNLSIAQQEFRLPSPGVCGVSRSPCQTQILHITNFSTYSRDKASRPQVYLSGELHGDERVGPHATLELARVLLESQNPWVRWLVDNRYIVLTPITNSIGYDRNRREENGVDPNRDYPIDQAPSKCMVAIASRIVNEVFRSHMFQLAVTFHGGMEAIAMLWGTVSRRSASKHKSPDDTGVMQLAQGLSDYSGPALAHSAPYPVGRMNDLVYPVNGGSR